MSVSTRSVGDAVLAGVCSRRAAYSYAFVMTKRFAAFGLAPPRVLSRGVRPRVSHFATTPRCSTSEPKRGCTAITWNVNSLRALMRKNPRALQDLVDQHDPDILCLQETKLQVIHEELFVDALKGYETAVFHSSQARLGYSGTAVYAKQKPLCVQFQIRHEDGDLEGRVVGVEYPGAAVVNVYTMNAGAEFKRLDKRLTWDSAFRSYIRNLRREGKPVVVLGDLNVAREEADVHNPKTANKLPGFSDDERRSFEDTLETCGLVDAYRMLYPDERERYTFWDYKSKARERNRGWRIDYALVSDDMVRAVKDVRILDHVEGSDHCPVAIELTPGLIW